MIPAGAQRPPGSLKIGLIGLVGLVGLIGLIGRAAALPDDDVRIWEGLYDARLIEAADGTPAIAIQYYEELLQELPADAPQRPEVLYWLGRARFSLGDLDGAIAALQEAARSPDQRPMAEALLSRIELQRRGAIGLPIRWDFSQGPMSFSRSLDDDAGRLATRLIDGNPALIWPMLVRSGGIGHISLSLAQELPIRYLAFRARAERFPANLQVVLLSPDGGRFSAPLVVVPTGRWMRVEWRVESFRAIDGRAEAPLRRARVVVFQELTGYLSSDRGDNALFIDDLRIE